MITPTVKAKTKKFMQFILLYWEELKIKNIAMKSNLIIIERWNMNHFLIQNEQRKCPFHRKNSEQKEV